MNITQIIVIAGLIVFSYLLGSIPTAYWMCKKIANVDIREVGSGNVGANNTRRVMGNIPAIGVLLIDILKGVIPVLMAMYCQLQFNIHPELSILPALTALLSIVGHTKSIFINFTGGKGAATAFGTLLILCWPVALIVGVLSGILAKLTKFKAMGVYVVTPFAAILMWLFAQPVSYIIYCLVISLYMFYLFRNNLKLYIKKENVD